VGYNCILLLTTTLRYFAVTIHLKNDRVHYKAAFTFFFLLNNGLPLTIHVGIYYLI